MSCFFVPVVTADLQWRHGLPFSGMFEDVYFSRENGLEESRYVFIEANRLLERWQAIAHDSADSFVIAETGFGTGLNFLLTWSLWLQHAPETARLHFISCEKHPLSKNDLAKCLQLWPELSELATQLQEQYPLLTPGFHHLFFQQGRVRLTLMLGDALDCFQQLLVCGERELERQLRGAFVDAWYLDGFAPAKNEAMWSKELFDCISLLSKGGTTLATFSAAKKVKEHLQRCGFTVSRRKGYGRKRDMIAACLHSPPAFENKKKHTPWHAAKTLNVNNKKAIVLGAGLAGCFVSRALARRGWQVSLIDAAHKAATGASANRQAVLFPKLSAYRSPLTEFMLASFLFAVEVYRDVLRKVPIGHLEGALLLAHQHKERQAQLALKNWLCHYPELARLVDQDEASELAGISLAYGGMYLPHSGWIHSQDLCAWLIESETIDFCSHTEVENIHYDKGLWQAADKQAEVLIVASGYRAAQFQQTSYLPIKPIRGQMSAIAATDESRRLQLPVCASGHVLPAVDGCHWLGATYELGKQNHDCKKEDDQQNLQRLHEYAPGLHGSDEVIDSWTAVRATTPDYLPLVGPVANEKGFTKQYKKFAANANIWLGEIADYYPGLFVCTGFGSRGLTSIPLASEFLASLINKEMNLLPTHLIKAISPARFLRKRLARGG